MKYDSEDSLVVLFVLLIKVLEMYNNNKRKKGNLTTVETMNHLFKTKTVEPTPLLFLYYLNLTIVNQIRRKIPITSIT